MVEQESEATEPDVGLPTEKGRYGEFRLDDGDLVVFDRRAPDTWVQSDTTVRVEQ